MVNKEKNIINKCKQCNRCCSYFCVQVDVPQDMDDIDGYVWILAHQGVSIHIEDDEWYLYVENRCKYIGEDGKCQIYDERPAICRNHTPGECEFDSNSLNDYDDSDLIFTDIKELRAWGEENMTEDEDEDSDEE